MSLYRWWTRDGSWPDILFRLAAVACWVGLVGALALFLLTYGV